MCPQYTVPEQLPSTNKILEESVSQKFWPRLVLMKQVLEFVPWCAWANENDWERKGERMDFYYSLIYHFSLSFCNFGALSKMSA